MKNIVVPYGEQSNLLVSYFPRARSRCYAWFLASLDPPPSLLLKIVMSGCLNMDTWTAADTISSRHHVSPHAQTGIAPFSEASKQRCDL
jgi:hypothetical protein